MKNKLINMVFGIGLAGLSGCLAEKEEDFEDAEPVVKYNNLGQYGKYGGIAVGDMDGDERNDIIVISLGYVYVFLNNGDGTYSPQTKLKKN